MDELLELLKATIDDDAQRSAIVEAIQKDRAGLEANKQQVLDELKKERQSRKSIEDNLNGIKSAFGERSPEDVKTMLDRLENDEMARLAAEGKTDELLKRHREKWEAERKPLEADLQKQIDELNKAKQQLEAQLTSELIDNRALAAATKAGAIPESLDVIKMLAKSAWKLEDGEPVMRDQNGEIETLSFDDWATKHLRETHPYLFPQPKGSNAPGSNSGGQTKANPWKTDTLNLTEQARIMRENPSLAERLKAEAQE